MMSFHKFTFSLLTITQIAYTLSPNNLSDKLYRDISKSLNPGLKSETPAIAQVLNPKFIRRVELVLSNKYGDKEVAYFRNMLAEFTERELKNEDSEPLFDASLKEHVNSHFNADYVRDFGRLDDPNETSEDLVTARTIVKLIKFEFEKFGKLKELYITPNMSRFTQIRELSEQLPGATDTPCNTQAECARVEMLMNLCSTIRGGVNLAYDIFATMVHVLGNMLSVLCGCIFVGPAQVCLLKNFPYTCRIPYPAFSQLFQSTYSVWELVKITTNLCRVYGDIGFGSRFG